MSICVICAADLGKSRSDRRTCSARCRVALSRRRAAALARRAMNDWMLAAVEDENSPEAKRLWAVYLEAAEREGR